MANAHLDTAFVDKAIKFAVDAHANTERRGKGFPYVIHVLEAMEIVATITPDPELLAAAALHDTVEDTDVSFEDIRREFGEKVANLVASESDTPVAGSSEQDSWRARKQAAIDRLAAAPYEAKIVALGDKLSNMRAICRDYNRIGNKLWGIFHAPGGMADHEWHYRGLAESLCELAGTDAYSEFCAKIEEVFGREKPELIDMDDYEQSGEGFTATSYFSKTGDKMIKLYTDYVSSTEPEKELKLAKSVKKLGVRTPEVYRLVTDGKRIGVEFERIRDKKSYARAISDEPERMEEYTKAFAVMCRQLHSTPCNTADFLPISARFINATNNSARLSLAQKGKVIKYIHGIKPESTCTHGDMQIGNAIMANGVSYWIDLAGFSYGNPLFDLGMLAFVMTIESDEVAQNLYHLSCSQLARVWDIFLKEYYGPDADIEKAKEDIAPVVALYMIDFCNRSEPVPGMMEYINKYFPDND